MVCERRGVIAPRLALNRAETRRPGPIESGLDVKSVLSVVRTPSDEAGSSGLDDNLIALAKSDNTADRELLLWQSPNTRYTILHDRDWHIYWDDDRQVIFKRLDHGELVAQLNMAAGPDAGAGRHQDPNQFRDDLRKALGARFVRVAAQGEVEGMNAGIFAYGWWSRGSRATPPSTGSNTSRPTRPASS